MKARSWSATGEVETLSAVPHSTHITSSSMSGSEACGAGARGEDEQHGREQRERGSRLLPQQRRQRLVEPRLVDRPAALRGDPARGGRPRTSRGRRASRSGRRTPVPVTEAGVREPEAAHELRAPSRRRPGSWRRARSRSGRRSPCGSSPAAAAPRCTACTRRPRSSRRRPCPCSRPARTRRRAPSTGSSRTGASTRSPLRRSRRRARSSCLRGDAVRQQPDQQRGGDDDGPRGAEAHEQRVVAGRYPGRLSRALSNG